MRHARKSGRGASTCFHVIENLWGFTKVRYRGLAKNTVRVYAAFALANLYQVRHTLRPRASSGGANRADGAKCHHRGAKVSQ